MGLEDLAMMRTIPGSVVLYPSDGNSAWAATQLVANYKGIGYIRNGRPVCPVIYPNTEVFEIGKCKVVEKGETDKITVIGGGITVHEAKKAAANSKVRSTFVSLTFSVCNQSTKTLLSAMHAKQVTRFSQLR